MKAATRSCRSSFLAKKHNYDNINQIITNINTLEILRNVLLVLKMNQIKTNLIEFVDKQTFINTDNGRDNLHKNMGIFVILE